jgi:hypothetical protein
MTRCGNARQYRTSDNLSARAQEFKGSRKYQARQPFLRSRRHECAALKVRAVAGHWETSKAWRSQF